jgi:ribosomal protein S15P/S13E
MAEVRRSAGEKPPRVEVRTRRATRLALHVTQHRRDDETGASRQAPSPHRASHVSSCAQSQDPRARARPA